MSSAIENRLIENAGQNIHNRNLEQIQPAHDQHTRNESYSDIKYHPKSLDTKKPIFSER